MIGVLLSTCGKHDHDAAHNDTYTCPMHPTVIQDKPGSCPVCGMDLVRKSRPGEELKITEDVSRLLKSPNEVVVGDIKTIKGEYKSNSVVVDAQGIVTYDSRNLSTISARIGGRLERVYLRFPFQKVSKGQKVADIYSPEMIVVQRELIYLLENDSHNEAMIGSAKERLRLLGATSAQIEQIASGKKVQNTFTLYSPVDGYIISSSQQSISMPSPAKASLPASSMSDGMSSNPGAINSMNRPASTPSTEELIKEGSYVTSGQDLFKVINTSSVRVELQLSGAVAASIKNDDKVELDLGNGNMESGSIDVIQPFINEGEQLVTIRVVVKNVKDLRIGQLVKATLNNNTPEAMWVPRESVINLGTKSIVFRKERNTFRPFEVVTGNTFRNEIEIKHGLSSADEIALNAQYLVDSESFVKIQN